jgi:glycosyltransferase involved in cell wall biosynthesis
VCAEGEPFREKTSFLRERLGLSEDKRIIVYAGFIADWAMCAEIAENAQSWPENWVMVFHTHGYNDESYIKKVRSFERSNVRFSMSPVPYDELSPFLASADIGVALYRDLGANFTLISSASGKLAHYLKSGLPVLVNSYPNILQVVNKYHCGICIDNPNQLPEAIDKILNNYERMRSGAYLCYEENYRFDHHFAKVVDRIGRL